MNIFAKNRQKRLKRLAYWILEELKTSPSVVIAPMFMRKRDTFSWIDFECIIFPILYPNPNDENQLACFPLITRRNNEPFLEMFVVSVNPAAAWNKFSEGIKARLKDMIENKQSKKDLENIVDYANNLKTQVEHRYAIVLEPITLTHDTLKEKQ